MTSNSSNSNSKPWDNLELLNRRKEAVPLLDELGFLALLETLAEGAVVPVSPHAVNWSVQRAMQDGSLIAINAIKTFFDETTIQYRIQQKLEDEAKPKPNHRDLSPYLKPVNPYAPKE